MACNIRAHSEHSRVTPPFTSVHLLSLRPFRRVVRAASATGAVAASILVLALSGMPSTVRAERADRAKPLQVEADAGRYDDLRQVGVFTGNVVVTKGTMVLRAQQIEVRQTPDGFQSGIATSQAGRLATFRQKRDGVDETIEGEAERIEYDGRSDTVRFINKAVVRRLRGSTVADETTGNLITYDNVAEVFNVSGGSSAASATNPGGRVRAVITPREGTEGAAPPAAPAASRATSTPLRPADALGGGGR